MKRSKVTQLPKEVKAWLDRALVEGNFSGYEQLEKELVARGCTMGKSSIHRYGQKLELRLSAVRASTDAARQIAEAAPDDADQRSNAVISMVQTEIFNVLMLMQEALEDGDLESRLKTMGRAAKAVAELSRASVNNKKWAAEVRDKASTAADAVESIIRKSGASEELMSDIRSRIMGIAK